MIFFLYGADTFRSRQKLREIKEKFRKEVDQSGLNLSRIDGARTDLDNISRQMSSAPFLAKRRMVVVEDIFLNKDEELFEGLVKMLKADLAKTDPGACLKIFWDSLAETPKKSAPGYELYQLLAKQQFASEFPLLQGQPLAYWVHEEFRKNGVVAGRGDIEKLTMLAGNDSWQLKNEIDKLSAYALGQGSATVTGEMIVRMVVPQFDDNIFKLVDAVSQRQKGAAIQLVNEQLQNGANEMYLLSMINRSFRILNLVKETPIQDQAKLGLHPFVLKKASSQAQRFQSADLKRIYQKLLDCDEQIKTGLARPVLLINMLLAGI